DLGALAAGDVRDEASQPGDIAAIVADGKFRFEHVVDAGLGLLDRALPFGDLPALEHLTIVFLAPLDYERRIELGGRPPVNILRPVAEPLRIAAVDQAEAPAAILEEDRHGGIVHDGAEFALPCLKRPLGLLARGLIDGEAQRL